MSTDAMRDGYFHGRVEEAPPMPAKASAMTFSLDGTTPLVGLAVQSPPLEVMGRDGAHMGSLELLQLTGFVILDADLDAALAAGQGWTVTCDPRTGQTDVRTADGELFSSVTIPLLAGDEGVRWRAEALTQGALPVITGPGVTVDLATGGVEMDPDQTLWLFADFKTDGAASKGA
ncbi:hypothetical protein F7Q99_35890 [Streptomyces kaniharaensis]|uniref:Uncharacterized protein n=1 Tax=Streptomyces kaniharaensis TaxID=212423 RepID=A0A6N7L5U3_9ACTN|nr:hypothetical protein [Streptomyces kaniharaensis]MQS17423.1 hypothetical protein [Streptomyces kaniharaensis]